MPIVNSFIAASSLTILAIVFSVVSVLALLFAILFIWWVDTKKRPLKEFFGIIGSSIYRFFDDIFRFFNKKSTVKTVYSDKSLNYSGTEFLPIPTKAPTNQYTYEFVGWDKNGIDEQGNTVVRAIYLQKVIVCKVSVYDVDKLSLLASYDVDYGAGINLDHLKPHKNDTKEFSYEFIGWDKKTDAFYKDEKIYPVFNAVPKKYTYTFYEEDGKTVVNQGTAIYGTPIIAPAAPKKETKKSGIYEFAGWKGYESNAILTKDVDFSATYTFKPYGGEGSSSIIKKDGDKIKVVDETSLTEQEDARYVEIKKKVTTENLKFDSGKEAGKQNVTEIKLGQSGVIRKRGNGAFIQMNSNDDEAIEKFKRISTSLEQTTGDKDVHQKIQLMTVKKSAEVEPDEQTVITIKPKKAQVSENDIINNMMVVNQSKGPTKAKNDKK